MTEVENNILFQVKDPRGKDVICTKNYWESHILARHPEVEGWEDNVIAAISNPRHNVIYKSPNYSNRLIYYRKPKDMPYLKVVVTETESGLCKVVTTHFVSQLQPGEIMIWPESKS